MTWYLVDLILNWLQRYLRQLDHIPDLAIGMIIDNLDRDTGGLFQALRDKSKQILLCTRH